MTLDLFNQFSSPHFFGIPLLTLALAAPLMTLPAQSRLIENRTITIQKWLLLKITKQILSPLNKPGHNWALMTTTLMYYLLLINLLGMLPYTFTPTTQLSMNLGLAMPLWLATVLLGARTQPNNSLAHMLPMSTPPLLIPILITIETISLLIRPLALGVRLTANLTAGHLLMTLISTAVLALLTTMPVVSLLTTILLLLLTLLEVTVAMIQAYVFTLLLSLYLQENT